MKPFSQACENNRQPILDVLRRVFSDRQGVLEIGSGTGQHAVYFARHLPYLQWQTSDLSENLEGINAWLAAEPSANLLAPVMLNVKQPSWPELVVDAVFTANTLHIMSWESVTCFFSQIPVLFQGQQGTLAAYGPFNYQGNYTSESNARFDQWLKDQGAECAIRDFEQVNALAEQAGLHLVEDNAMPANNRLLVWESA